MKSKKLVSLLVPSFNGSKYFNTFFDSIVKQTYRPIEVYIVDDGSTDGSRELAKTLINKYSSKDCSFNYIYQNHSGQSKAINTGLKLINGSFFAWTDIDDILLPDNIEIKVKLLLDNNDVDFVLTNGKYVEESSGKILFFWGRKEKDFDRKKFFEDLIMERNVSYGPGSILIRTSSFLKIFPDMSIIESPEGQNWQLILPIAYSLNHFIIDADECHYLKHNDSHSNKPRTTNEMIDRNDSFYSLIHKILESIKKMPSDDFNRFEKIICLKYNERNLYLCYKNFLFKKAKKYKKSLKQNGVFCWKHNFLGYQINRVFQVFKNKVFSKKQL